jgi:lysophospholipase L1-like esterase
MQTKRFVPILAGLLLGVLMSTHLLGGKPSTGKEQAQTKAPTGYSAAADQARKAKMSPDELAWEKVLEANLGDFYLPRYKKDKEAGTITAWDYVGDAPGLPRVLLIGDSISRGYTVPVRDALKGEVNVHRAPANCGPTATGIKKLDVWLGNGKWDLIVFNFGIHDRNTSSKDYLARLETIVDRLKKTGAKLIWVTTTPIPVGAPEYVKGAVPRLNEAASMLMKKHAIPVIDMNAAITPVLDKYQLPKNCHYTDEGYTFMGNIVAEAIRKQLVRK